MNVKRDASEVIAAIVAKMRDEGDVQIFGWPRAIQQWADELEATLPAAEPADAGRDAYPFGQSEYPEQVIRLLIAGGYVSQAKVDEARAIALNLQPEPLSPPSEGAAVDDAMVDAFAVAEQRVYNEIHDMATPDLYRLAVRKGIEAALASQQAVKP